MTAPLRFGRTKAFLLGLVVALVLAEAGLRAKGFEFKLYPTRIQFGWPDPSSMRSRYTVDEALLWVPKDYEQRVEAAVEAPPAHVFMGCSCTGDGHYDEAFAKLLAEEHPGRTYDYLNLGVGGWSSYQGAEQMARDVTRIRPKLATVYYGWNDHWCTFGIEDKAIGAFNLEHSRALTWLSEHSGVVQLFNKALFKSRFDGLPEQLRVALPDFRANLERIVDLARAIGTTPVLMTAPSAHEEGDEPVYLQMRWLRRKEDLVPLHRSYAAVVREVAAERNVLLVDLLARFDELPRDERRGAFVSDGVHLNEKGDALIARYLYEALAEAGLVDLLLR